MKPARNPTVSEMRAPFRLALGERLLLAIVGVRQMIDAGQHGAEHEDQQPQARQINAERAHDLARLQHVHADVRDPSDRADQVGGQLEGSRNSDGLDRDIHTQPAAKGLFRDSDPEKRTGVGK